MKYFVIAVGGHNRPVPIIESNEDDDSENIALYNTKKEAHDMADNQPMCVARGYEIMEWPHKIY